MAANFFSYLTVCFGYELAIKVLNFHFTEEYGKGKYHKCYEVMEESK